MKENILFFGKTWLNNHDKYARDFFKLLEVYDGRFKPLALVNHNWMIFSFNGTQYDLSDNGGELNISKTNYGHVASVPYTGSGLEVNLYSLFLMFTKSIENGELFYTTESLSDSEIETLINHNESTVNGKIGGGEII